MNESRMKDRVNTWTLQVVAASRFLLNLYRVLGDDKQAYRAMMAGKASIERLGRLHLVDQAECTAAIRNPELLTYPPVSMSGSACSVGRS